MPNPIISHCQKMQQLLQHSNLLAQLNRPIVILGERGTGKELFAQRLHYLSPRWDKTFVRVNCASFSDSLLDSELFGHEAGAYTDARKRRQGLFERAHGGSLFLDELGTLSSRVQEKLLRVLEYGELERLGGEQQIQVDVRVIAATNEDLVKACEQGRFRWDLLDRLCFDCIQIPPLRERQADIEALAEHFAMRMSQELGWPLFAGFSHQALLSLQQHDWPGNVRELKSTVERSLAQHPDPSAPIDRIRHNPLLAPAATSPNDSTSPAKTSAQDLSLPAISSTLPLKVQVQKLEHHCVKQALMQHQGNQQRAAEQLGLSYHQLRAWLKREQLNVKQWLANDPGYK